MLGPQGLRSLTRKTQMCVFYTENSSQTNKSSLGPLKQLRWVSFFATASLPIFLRYWPSLVKSATLNGKFTAILFCYYGSGSFFGCIAHAFSAGRLPRMGTYRIFYNNFPESNSPHALRPMARFFSVPAPALSVITLDVVHIEKNRILYKS